MHNIAICLVIMVTTCTHCQPQRLGRVRPPPQPPLPPGTFPIIGLVDDISGPLPTPTNGTQKKTKVMESFHVRTDIRYRFATTQMSSVVRNVGTDSQEIAMDVTLPKEAFIVAFHMTIDGKRYDGEVKERKEAKRQYQEAVDMGQSAGHVRQAPRHANVFEVSVNVAAGSAVNFTLSYQEILRRQRGYYEHEIHVNPGEPVEDFRIEVNILENRPLKFVRTPALRTDFLLTNIAGAEKMNELTVVDRPSPEAAFILFEPSLSQQGDKGKGLEARFVVQYDVERGGPGGDVLVVDGYFVHFLAPDSPQKTLPKDIIFVLDVSGSMSGPKIAQLKVAMDTILSDINPEDRLNIISFSSDINKWKEGLVDATSETIADAKLHVAMLRAAGMTNINDALLSSIREMKDRNNNERVGIVFFLTDGHPTVGVQNGDDINRNVLNLNEGNAAVFSLAFGEGADFDMLKSLSAQNLGFARKIYEASDAALQVSSLYGEISAVSVKDMHINYKNSSVDEFTITDTDFPIVFNGTEIIICGMLAKDAKTLKYEVTGRKRSGVIDFEIEQETDNNVVIFDLDDKQNDNLFSGPRDFSGQIEKMWAYTTIKQLLRQKEKHSTDETRVSEIEKKVLDISLKYKFVTPLTSMVVTKPNQEKTEVRESKIDEASADFAGLPQRAKSSRRSFPMRSGGGSGPSGHRARASTNGVLSLPPRYNSFDSDPIPILGLRQQTILPPATRMFTTRTTTTTATPSPSIKSHLQLLSLTVKSTNTSTYSSSICVVPKRWKFGRLNIFTAPSGIKVVLVQCNRRRCKKLPALQSVLLISGNGSTEVLLNGSPSWRYVSSRSNATVRVVSKSQIMISEQNIDVYVNALSRGNNVDYNIQLKTDAVQDVTKYGGILGHYLSLPEQSLKKLSKKRSRKTCRYVDSDLHVLLNNGRVKKFMVKKSKGLRRNKAGRRSRRRHGRRGKKNNRS